MSASTIVGWIPCRGWTNRVERELAADAAIVRINQRTFELRHEKWTVRLELSRDYPFRQPAVEATPPGTSGWITIPFAYCEYSPGMKMRAVVLYVLGNMRKSVTAMRATAAAQFDLGVRTIDNHPAAAQLLLERSAQLNADATALESGCDDGFTAP